MLTPAIAKVFINYVAQTTGLLTDKSGIHNNSSYEGETENQQGGVEPYLGRRQNVKKVPVGRQRRVRQDSVAGVHGHGLVVQGLCGAGDENLQKRKKTTLQRVSSG